VKRDKPILKWSLVFTGGRTFKDQEKFNSIILVLDLDGPGRPTEIHVGDCPTGLDYMARGVFVEARVHVADWQKHGRAAGPIRNKAMLEAAGKHSLLVAFPGGRGTTDCVRQAKAMGITVLKVET
jgi:hypothetical protein